MFTYPALLWFLPILGVVVLIHLINMFRHRKVEWAAMEFLLAAYRKSRTRILLQQLLLMLLRTAAVAAVILMFADPKLEGELAQWFGAAWLGKRGTHHIVLLDDSYSMNERNLAQGGTPLFEDALAVVQRIAEGRVAGGGANDRFTLLKLSSADPVLHELPMHADGLQTIQNVLLQQRPSSFAHEPERMLTAAADFVRQTVGLNPVVYFLSDFRQRNWENPAPFLTQIETIRQHGGNVRMIRVATALTQLGEQSNLGIEQLHLVEGIHAADVDVLLDATIVNYGREAAENVLVTLFVNDQLRSQQTVPHIPAGGRTVPPIRFPVRVSGGDSASLPGHRIEVRLQPDALPDDNQRFMVLQVPDVLEVLLIAPVVASAAGTSAQHVRVALAPGGTRSGILVRQESPSYLAERAERALDRYSAIFVLDIPTLEPAAVRALEHYVANGGGVAFFPGTNTDLHFVRDQLYRGGSGLFPAAPIAVQELLPDFLTGATDLRLVPHTHTAPHPIFRLFSDGESPLLGSVVIERHLAVEPVADPATHAASVNVWATLRNDAPLVLEKTFGAGRTMTFLTSASPTWNNWGRNPSFVVVLLELTAYLSRRAEQSQTFLVGDPLTVTINPMEFEERVRFVPPPREGETTPPPPREGNYSPPSEGGHFAQQNVGVVSLPTDRPGFYTVYLQSRLAGEQSVLKAVNVNASEGDIRQIDVTELSDILRTIRQPLESAAGFTTVSDFAARQSISDWLLYAVILFLLGEIFLAGRMQPLPVAPKTCGDTIAPKGVESLNVRMYRA